MFGPPGVCAGGCQGLCGVLRRRLRDSRNDRFWRLKAECVCECVCVAEGKCILGFCWHRHSDTFTHNRTKMVNNGLCIDLTSHTAQAIRRLILSRVRTCYVLQAGVRLSSTNSSMENKDAQLSWQKGQTEVELWFGWKSIRCLLSVIFLIFKQDNQHLKTFLRAFEPEGENLFRQKVIALSNPPIILRSIWPHSISFRSSIKPRCLWIKQVEMFKILWQLFYSEIKF